MKSMKSGKNHRLKQLFYSKCKIEFLIINQDVWVSIDDIPYFSGVNMGGAFVLGNVAIGTSYYKVMFDNILVEPK